MWQYWDHQITKANIADKIIKEFGLVYFNMEERTGKCGTIIALCEDLNLSKGVLVLTTKEGIKGWKEALANLPCIQGYEVTNYHQAHKYNPNNYSIIVLDECHQYISGYPKPSKLWHNVAKLCKNKPLIYSSATAYAEGSQLLYHQFKLSNWSPFDEFNSFYDWFKHYADRDSDGKLKVTYINNQQTVIDYTAIKHEEVIKDVRHLFVSGTRVELGFDKEPEDVVHYVELNDTTKNVYNILGKHKVIEFTSSINNKDYKLVCDSSAKLRAALHMLEGGVLKIDEEYVLLGNTEKIDYILNTWGDTSDLVIMYYYVAEKEKLEKYFHKAKILQAVRFAEGVDLSMYKHLVIYSQNWSAAKHTQRRARQANMNRTEDINVHFLLVKKAISDQVYKSCAIKKKNFVDSSFKMEEL